MVTISRITINDDGHIVIPLQLNKRLKLQNNDWLRVSRKSDCTILIPARVEMDEEIVEDLIHQGILIDVIQMSKSRKYTAV